MATVFVHAPTLACARSDSAPAPHITHSHICSGCEMLACCTGYVFVASCTRLWPTSPTTQTSFPNPAHLLTPTSRHIPSPRCSPYCCAAPTRTAHTKSVARCGARSAGVAKLRAAVLSPFLGVVFRPPCPPRWSDNGQGRGRPARASREVRLRWRAEAATGSPSVLRG